MEVFAGLNFKEEEVNYQQTRENTIKNQRFRIMNDLVRINRKILGEIIEKVCKRTIERETRCMRFEIERLRRRVIDLEMALKHRS